MRLTAAMMLWFVLGLPAGTVHTDEPIGSASNATIFELK
jgi:hypothetical protein